MTESYVCERVKKYRKLKKMSLTEFAGKLGLSVSYVSQIENGKANLSVSLLLDIVKILNISSISVLLEEGDRVSTGIVSREKHQSMVRNDLKVILDMLIVSPEKTLQSTLLYIPAGFDTGKPHSHKGEEICYQLEGESTLYLDGDVKYFLRKGDLAYYPAHMPHKWNNDGTEDARILVICSPASF